MSKFRAWFRLIRFIWITFTRASWIVILEALTTKSRHRRDLHKMAWAKAIVKAMGLQIEIKGNIPDNEGVLVTPNHRSYIDIPVITSLSPVSHLAKAEVKKWPIVGWGAQAVDTLFVDRDNQQSRNQARVVISKMLQSGHPVCVYPEGTSTKAPDMKPWKAGAFQACVEHGLAVIPVAIEYQDPDDAWVGEETFMPHFLRAFGKKSRKIYISAGPPMKGNDTLALMQQARSWVENELARIRAEKGIKA